MHRDQDFLMRQVHAFAAGLLRTLGAKTHVEEEDECDLLERELEVRIGFPFDVVKGMALHALVDFLSVEGKADADRMLLCGLIFARRSVQESNERHRVLALALVVRAIETKPQLLDEQISGVLDALADETSSAMNTPANR